jgi:exodeoxyribonuclease III
MKIASWNVNSIKARFTHLIEFIDKENPDILLLQETKCTNHNFPLMELEHLGYNIYIHGEKSYNGVAIFSKFKADDITYNFPNNPLEEQARFLEITASTSIGFIRIISLYAPNGGEIDSDKFNKKLEFYDALTSYLAGKKTFDEKLIIGGDFNIAPFDIDVYSPNALAETTCFTLRERQKLRSLLNLGFADLYRLFHPVSQEFSWWDYRAGGFEQNRGMRIDMILSSYNATNYFTDCYMDYHQRAKEKPSDHIPIVVCTTT